MLDKLFYFKQGEHVKVQVFNIITEGKVISRKLEEDVKGFITKTYHVQYGNRLEVIVVFEEDLIEVQNLHLGSIVDE